MATTQPLMCSVNESLCCRLHETDGVDKVMVMATGSSASCHFLWTTHTLLPAQSCLLATSGGHTNTRAHTHTCLTLYQPVDGNLVEEMRKCFISQLPLVDKARVPTVRKAWGQMWPITPHPLTGQISLSDLSPDRLTQYSTITIHIWIYLCMCVCVCPIQIQTLCFYSQLNCLMVIPFGTKCE